jgi:hypothetical protein
MMNKPQLHFSGISMFTKCGEQFRRRYILGEKIPPGISLIVGCGTDRSVSKNMENKKETGELLPVEQCLDIARDEVEGYFKAGNFAVSDEEKSKTIAVVKGEAIDKTVTLSRLHYTDLAPIIQPTHIQRQWLLALDNFPFDIAGTMDIQEGSKSIRDTKTSGKTPAGDIADKSDQLTMYAMAAFVLDGTIPEKVMLDYLINLKTPKSHVFESTRQKADFQPVLNRCEIVAESIAKEIFVPVNSDHWVCDPKWCGYYNSCKYVRKPVTVIGGI